MLFESFSPVLPIFSTRRVLTFECLPKVCKAVSCQLSVCENCLVFLQGVQDIVTEQRYIKDGIAKNVVEMAKREWPQNWANMLQEINECAQMGVCNVKLYILEISYSVNKLKQTASSSHTHFLF